MEKKITAIENGVESTYTEYDSSQDKYTEELILLIKIANTKGEKIIFLRNEYNFNMLKEKFKIEIENYSIKTITWIDDFDEIYSLRNISVFIFWFDSYCSNPEFQIDSYSGDSEINSIINESKRKNLKEVFSLSSKNDKVNYFFSESLISEVEKQRIEKFDYFFIDISKGNINKKNLNASNQKFKLNRFKDYKLYSLFSSGINSGKSCIFYYPHKSKNEEESSEESGIIEILYPNSLEYYKYIARFLWIYLGKKNIGIEKVPTLVKDKSGNYILPGIFINNDVKSDQLGFQKYIPSKEEIYEVNSINSLLHFLKFSEVEFFNDKSIVAEIQKILDTIIGSRIKFIPTKTIFTLNINIKEDDSDEDIYILNADEFLKFKGNYFNKAFDELKQIKNWAVYYNRNLKYIL